MDFLLEEVTAVMSQFEKNPPWFYLLLKVCFECGHLEPSTLRDLLGEELRVFE